MQSNTQKWLKVGLIFYNFLNSETNPNFACDSLLVTCVVVFMHSAQNWIEVEHFNM